MGAMDTKIGVNLAFSADTTKVKSQLTDLQNQLTKLVSVGASGKGVTGINSEIQESIASAAKLKVQLEAATNVRTGQLDLSKFNESLKKSGMTLQQYGQQLSNLGPAGDQAFAQLSKAIVNAEMPLKKSSALLTNFANTLKNTVKWQISSSMVHGFMGAIQGAYGYAQSLDKSLNNIRIVTGQSAEQMAVFAKEANKAARELSTTTVAYTDAALIFYQQGLDDEAVKARTDATIKMANVTGDSATEVSSYMTAIWNNFAKGSNNLEHFSDVITALGASTASSSEEIAGGLEKFAAVGNTIGLSYEYAATSLATIVAATRQSEDTVGTALKTIFSRIQGLKLGETLDDGTELNKYSNALLAVGVNIKDVTGEIKDMDTILNELGSRWKMLTKDQQMALAQTVAGTRQYTQLVALMAHWEEFQENLTVAQNSDGSLDKQAKIYADSWESAQKRVRTAAQNIYSSLIDEKFFIKGLGWMEKFLDSINNIIKGLGGIQGIVPLIGGLLMKAFSKDMVNGINSMTYNLKMLTPSGRASEKQMKSEANSLLIKQALDAASNTGTSVQGDVYAGQAQAQKILIENAERLSAEDQKIVSILMDQREILGQQWVESQKVAEAAAKEVTARAEILQHENPGLFATKAKTEAYLKLDEQIEECAKELSQLQAAEKKLGAISQTESKNVKKVAASIKSVLVESGKFSGEIEKEFNSALEGGVDGLKEFAKKTKFAKDAEDAFKKKISELVKMLTKGRKAEKQAAKEAQEYADVVKKKTDAIVAETTAGKNYQESLPTINGFIQESITRSITFGDVVLGVGKGITSLSMAINSFSGLSDIWSDDDVSIGQKLLSTITTLGFTLPMVGGAINSLLKPMMIAKAESVAINALKATELQIDGELTTQKIQDAILEEALLKKRIGKNNAILKTVEGLTLEQKAKEAENYATEEEIKLLELAKQKEEAFHKSILSNPYIFWGAIILGIITAIGVGIAANAKKEREENAKTAEMLQKQSEKRSQEAKDHLAEIDSLVEKYNELSESYNNNETSLSQLQVEMYNQLEALGMHKEAVEALIGSYKELDKMMRQAQIDANNEVIETSEENAERIKNSFKAQFINDLGEPKRDQTDFGNGTENSIDIYKGADTDFGGLARPLVELSKELENLGIKSSYEDAYGDTVYGHISTDDFIKIASENKNALTDILLKYANGNDSESKDAANQLLGYLNTYSDKIDAYQNEIKSAQDAKLSNIGLENYQKGTITNIEEYNAKIKELTEKANEVLHDEEKAKKWAESYLAKDNSVTDIIRKDALKTSTRRKIAGSTDEEINKFLDNADEEILLSLNFNEGSTLEQVQKLYEVAQNELDRKKLEANVELIDNVSNKILSNESIDEETLTKLKEQYTDYDWDSFLGLNKKEQIEELNKLLIENDRIRRETYENEKKYMGSKDDQYKKDKDLLKEKEEELAKFKGVTTGSGRSYEIEYYKYAQKRAEELSEEIATLKNNMETLSNVEYDTNPFNEFMKEITSDVDQVVRYTEAVKSGAELIGEGFIVAKEDIQSFMKVYPEMAALAQVNADGSLQLNQEIVQQYLDGDKAKIEADASVIRTQLENQAMVLQSEIDHKKRKIENLKAFINGDIDYSTFKQNQDEEDTNHAKELMKIATDAQISNDQLAAASNDKLTEAELENIDAMGKKVNDLGNALVAALSGEGGTYEANGTAGIKHADLFDKLHTSAETISDDLARQLASARSEAEASEAYRKQALLSLESEEAALASLEEDAANVNLQISRLNNGVNSAISAFDGVGKGSGSSDKSKIKNLNDEIDRYHVIKNQLEDIEAQLDRISKAKERAFGAEKLNLIQQEIDAQKQLLAGNEEYLRQVSGNLGNERNALSAYGAQFDANGTITNYNALIAAQVSSYNAMGGSEEAEEAYNKFKDLLSKYEEDQDSFKELQQSIIDKKNEIYDLMLEKTQYSVEWKISIEDRELTYLEYLLERIENRAFSAAEAIANIGLQTEHLFNKSGANKSGILGLLQNHGYSAQDAQGILSQMESDTFDTNSLKDILRLTQGELDALDGWVDDLMSINQQLYEMRDKVWEELNKEFEEYNTKMEDGISKMEHLKSVTQSYQNIIGIVGKKTLGITNDLINYLNNTIAQQSRNILAGNKAELDAIKKAREDLAATFDENWTEEDKNKWQEKMDTIENKYREVESSFMSSWEEALQSAADAWKASVDNIIEDFSKKLAGTAGSLALLREQYDRTVEIDDRYLDDYEKIYHLTKLTREVGKAIDSTDNLNAKKELRELQEEILEMQKEGKEISQYDLDYETKKFELKQAQLALNEAQNAKSNVTMVRGDDGTYGYVYTADANAVENAEQNYEDKLYEMQKLNGDYIKSLQDNIIKAEEECMNAIQELNVADFANYEEYQARVDEITAYYQGKMGYYSSEMDKVLGNNKKLYMEDWQAYHDATGYKISEDQNYVDSFNETALSTLTGFQTMEEYQRAFNQTIGSPNDPNSLLGQLANNYNEWKDSVDLAMKAAGTSTENFSNKLDTEVNGQDGIKNNSEEAMRSVEEMAKDMQTAFAETINTVGQWASDYGTKIGEMISANDKLIASYNALRTAMGLKTTSSVQNTPSIPSNPGPVNPNPEDSGNRGGVSANGGKFISEPAHYDADGRLDVNHPPAATNGIFYLVDTAPGKDYPYGIAKKPGSRRYGWVSAFKTGGYTGDWTGEGKLALLHQKEMVLNSEDTSNMLSIVDMVRQIAKVIDLNAAAASGMYSSISSAYRVTGNNGAVQQEVTVYADFPGITSADGLEDAFKNIASDALHYINRNF